MNLVEYLKIPYVAGVHDCYTLIRFFYQQEFGINLPEVGYDRHWYRHNPSLILDSYKQAGFTQVADGYTFGDVLLLKDKGIPKHLGVIISDEEFLHTTLNGTCVHSFKQGVWAARKVAVFRHGTKGNP